MHIVIIGGGISGLYSAYKLLKLPNPPNPPNITIIEASDRLGGRIHTIKNNSFIYEGGAGRFSNKHKLLMKLISELGLEENLYPMGNNKAFVRDTFVTKLDENEYVKKLIQAASLKSIKELKSKTFIMFMHEVFQPSEVSDLINAFGYQSEFEVCNAFHAMKSIQDNFMAKVNHFGLKGGLSTIVQALENKFEEKRVKILKNWLVKDINPTTMEVIGEYNIKTDRFIVCVTKERLKQFTSLLSYDSSLSNYLDLVSSQPLYRIYAKFPANPEAWFKGLPRICTNNALRHIIPINASTGIIMICYTDGKWAEIWRAISSKKTLQTEIMKHLRRLFPEIDIPEPEFIDNIYWSEGAHYPCPNYKDYKQKSKYIICGEMMVSKNNGWIEGALSSVENGLKTLNI